MRYQYIKDLDTVKRELKENYDKEILLNSFDEALLNGIINDGLKYDERIAGHFKGNNPTLFLYHQS